MEVILKVSILLGTLLSLTILHVEKVSFDAEILFLLELFSHWQWTDSEVLAGWVVDRGFSL